MFLLMPNGSFKTGIDLQVVSQDLYKRMRPSVGPSFGFAVGQSVTFSPGGQTQRCGFFSNSSEKIKGRSRSKEILRNESRFPMKTHYANLQKDTILQVRRLR